MRVVAVHTGSVPPRYNYFTDGRERRSAPFNAVRVGLSAGETNLGERLYEWILSFAGEEDLRTALGGAADVAAAQRLTAELMTLVEQRFLRSKVAWYAALHQDTAHPHIHIVYQPPEGVGPLPERLFISYKGLPSDMARLVEEVTRRPLTIKPAGDCYWRVGTAKQPVPFDGAQLPPITVLKRDAAMNISAEEKKNGDDEWGFPPDPCGVSPLARLIAAVNTADEPPQGVALAVEDPKAQTDIRNYKENWYPTRDPDRWFYYAHSRAPILLNQIPEFLKKRAAWNVWIYRGSEGIRKKRPFDFKLMTGAATNKPENWHDHRKAVEFFLSKKQVEAYYEDVGGKTPAIVGGLSFLLRPEDHLVLIDLDHCRDPETNKIEEEALSIIENLPGYWEISASGEGFHGFFICENFEWTRTRGANGRHWIEVYSGKNAKAVAVTGMRIPNATPDIGPLSINGAAWLRQRFFNEPCRTDVKIVQSGQIVPDEEIVGRILKSRIAETYLKLAAGENVFPGANEGWSENDFRMVSMIAFYTQNVEQIERIFRKTERYKIREKKWEQKIRETTYGKMTIEKAIATLKQRFRWETTLPGGGWNGQPPQVTAEERAKQITNALLTEKKTQAARGVLEQVVAERQLPAVMETLPAVIERRLGQTRFPESGSDTPPSFRMGPPPPGAGKPAPIIAGLAPVTAPNDAPRLENEWREILADYPDAMKINRLAALNRIRIEKNLPVHIAAHQNQLLETHLDEFNNEFNGRAESEISLWEARKQLLRNNYRPEKVFADWVDDQRWVREHIPFLVNADGRIPVARFISDIGDFQQRWPVTGYILIAAVVPDEAPVVAHTPSVLPVACPPEKIVYIHHETLGAGEALRSIPYLPEVENNVREKFAAGLGRIQHLYAEVEQDPTWKRRRAALQTEQNLSLDLNRQQEIFRRLLRLPQQCQNARLNESDESHKTPCEPFTPDETTPHDAPPAPHEHHAPATPTHNDADLSRFQASPDGFVTAALENPVHWPALNAVALVYGEDVGRKLTVKTQRKIQKTGECLQVLTPYAGYLSRVTPMWRWTPTELENIFQQSTTKQTTPAANQWWTWDDVRQIWKTNPPQRPATAARVVAAAAERYIAERTAAYDNYLFRMANWRRFHTTVAEISRNLPAGRDASWRDTPWTLVWTLSEGYAQAMLCERRLLLAWLNREAEAVLETTRALTPKNSNDDLVSGLQILARQPEHRRNIASLSDYYEFAVHLHTIEQTLIRWMLDERQNMSPERREHIKSICTLIPLSVQIAVKADEPLSWRETQSALQEMSAAWQEQQTTKNYPHAARLNHLYRKIRDAEPQHPKTGFYRVVHQITNQFENWDPEQTIARHFDVELEI